MKTKTNENLILYVISTPIGNLQEFSPRAIQIIQNMDYIAAEDTRISGKLLNFFKIKKKFISCHKYNEYIKSKKVIQLLKEHNKIAYMCDSGTPCISDPGQILIQECIKNNIEIVAVNGPSALISAVVTSGLNCEHFYFHGFLKSKENERKKELENLKFKTETLIFYEAPHRIDKTLKNILTIFGNRQTCIAREISKKYENHQRGKLKDIIASKKPINKGEIVIVVEGFKKEENKILEEESTTMQKIKEIILFLKNKKISVKDAIKIINVFLKFPKKKIYQLYNQLK